jgi:hypothetical protein
VVLFYSGKTSGRGGEPLEGERVGVEVEGVRWR